MNHSFNQLKGFHYTNNLQNKSLFTDEKGILVLNTCPFQLQEKKTHFNKCSVEVPNQFTPYYNIIIQIHGCNYFC